MVTLLSSNSRCDPENNPQNNETTGRFFKHLSFFKSSFKHSRKHAVTLVCSCDTHSHI